MPKPDPQPRRSTALNSKPAGERLLKRSPCAPPKAIGQTAFDFDSLPDEDDSPSLPDIVTEERRTE